MCQLSKPTSVSVSPNSWVCLDLLIRAYFTRSGMPHSHLQPMTYLLRLLESQPKSVAESLFIMPSPFLDN